MIEFSHSSCSSSVAEAADGRSRESSRLPSITSYVFYFIEVEAAWLTVLRDCERSTGQRRWGMRCNFRLPEAQMNAQYLYYVEPPFSFSQIIQ
ncbi:MAG: hypothetical protein ACTSWQ_08700 [Candidatus Thorarchaeota archaeon]